MITLVDKDDNVIGAKARSALGPDDITRPTGLWLIGHDGRALISKRADDKLYSPGKWAPAVAGTVEEGETYLDNIVKEAKEEIGLDLDKSKFKVLLYGYVDASHKYWRTVFKYVLSEPVTIVVDARETSETRWVSKREFVDMYKADPEAYVSSMGQIAELGINDNDFK